MPPPWHHWFRRPPPVAARRRSSSRTSGSFQEEELSQVAAAAPRLQPPPKPKLPPFWIIFPFGQSGHAIARDFFGIIAGGVVGKNNFDLRKNGLLAQRFRGSAESRRRRSSSR